MRFKPSGATPEAFTPKLAAWKRAGVSALVVAAGAMAAAGCGSSSPSSSTLPSDANPVIVGTQPNSMPAPPAQTNVNHYAGIEMINGTIWSLYASHPDQSYSYQIRQGVSSVGQQGSSSAGGFSSEGDLEYLADTTQGLYDFAGLNAETPGGVSILDPASGGNWSYQFVVAVPTSQDGCLAPNGSVGINYIEFPSINSATPTTDTLYAYANLAYSNGTFSYSKVEQHAAGGASASTSTIPFANSYCISGEAGYALQSTPVTGQTGSSTMELYVGTSGMLAGTFNSGAPGASLPPVNLIGMVVPATPVSLPAVTAGTYKGFYLNVGFNGGLGDPAYFGASSGWVTSPVFSQTGSSLVGGFVDGYQWLYSGLPTPAVTGNIMINFGTQDSNHPGMFPSATITEQDLSNLCNVSQQSVGSDGNTYCTFPVVVMVGETYGKYEIFIAGPEPTVGAPLLYALVQD